MSRDEIMRLEGRELDAEVARRVMGFRQVTQGKDWPHAVGPLAFAVSPDPVEWYYWNETFTTPTGVWPCMDYLPQYHRDWAAMGDLVEHVGTPGQFRLSYGTSMQWWASFKGPGCQGSTAPEAVARAALCDVMGV